MKPKVRFAISVIIILIIGWVDIEYAGSSKNKIIPEIWQQVIHGIALLITMAIGYFNWRTYPGKWLNVLWLGCYSFILLLLLIMFCLYLVRGDLRNSFSSLVLMLRNVFIWPLPFLTFYLLSVVATNMPSAPATKK